MDSDITLSKLLLKEPPDKADEIIKLDTFVNSFKSEEQYSSDIYSEIFINLVETRLELIKEAEPDYMYIWKAFQATRLLTRNKNIQSFMYKEKHIKIYETILDKLVKTKSTSKAIECILIELLTIVKRYLYPEAIDIDILKKEKFVDIIINSSMVDNMILLLSSDNVIILKLLKYLFKPVLQNEHIISKFTKTSTIESMIQNIKKENMEITVIILDLIIILIDHSEFRNMFMFLGGYLVLITILKNHSKIDKESLSKILFLIQTIYKNEENLGDTINSSVITNLFDILLNSTNPDYLVNKIILNIFSAFALNDDLNVMIRSNWLESLFKLLTSLAIKVKSIQGATNEKNLILVNQTIITRILRLIFSLEKNRKFFKQLFPTSIFSQFIDIGNYKHNLTLYQPFVEGFNNLSQKELLEMEKKCERISAVSESEIAQSIGGYKIIEMIGKGGFGSVYKVKKNERYYAMKAIKLEEKQMIFIREHPNEIEKAISEIRIWKKFSHSNIIKYYTSFIEKGNVYIIMELVDGVSLGEYIAVMKENNTPIKEKMILNIITEIACGLKYMHQKANVIYKDLNPNNVMLDNSFNVKLIDFGLTIEQCPDNKEGIRNVNTSLTQSVSPVFEGSIFYSAPELMNNDKVTYGCDIWALGCITYEMLKLKPPFDGDNPLTIAKNTCELNYERLNEKDIENKELYEIVTKCLELEQKKRISINEICKILGPFLFEKIEGDRVNEMNVKKENEALKKIIEEMSSKEKSKTSNK